MPGQSLSAAVQKPLINTLTARIHTCRNTGSFYNAGGSAKRVPPCVYELENFLQRFGDTIAVYYKNLNSGFAFSHNPDRVFFGASVPKLYHALYVYTLAERGYITLDTTYTYTWADFWGGTGVMRHMPVGGYFTTRELLSHSVRDSDNIAFRMLARKYNHRDFSFRDFANEINANSRLSWSIIEQNVTARDAMVWAMAVHEYLQSDGRYAHYLRYDLKNTTVRFIQAEGDICIAQKYGWYRRHFHDLAIVYENSPYILIILSNRGEDGGAHVYNTPTVTHELFEEISLHVQEFNNRYFGRR